MTAYMPASKSDTHITPDEVFIQIWNNWGIAEEDFFDPCPVGATDGLEIDWQPLNYVNPPYGNGKKNLDGDTLLTRFVRKALYELNENNYTTIMLLPSKTDQKWFHWLIKRNFQKYWFDHRLKFKNNKWAATQPHFLVRIAP